MLSQFDRKLKEKGMGPLVLSPMKAAHAPASGHGLQQLHFEARKYSAFLDLKKLSVNLVCGL